MAETTGFLERHHFLLRRLHSLSGVAPIGVFLLFHLTTNASIVWGRLGGGGAPGAVKTFQHEVNFIHSLPALLLIEIFGLWLPILFHSVLGIIYAVSGRPNVGHYPYPGNRRYTLQRLSGYVGVLFIFYHVATLRWHWTFLIPGGTEWTAEYAASTMGAVLRGGAAGMTIAGLLVSAFYLLGVSLLVFHLANGLWTAAITWGLTISAQAQRRWGQVCFVIGGLLMLGAWSAVIGFATINHTVARGAEEGVHAPEPTPVLTPGMAEAGTLRDEH
ncbi:MAG: succinate dehydrogenase [Phycisphaerales bacterium]|nr:succinate dehydrogenase [Phycisphaerales bacterium]